ncbi:MAG: right-handed parallel beta-helix repeat-containing protein [Candidatus Eremiobacteraeota bacterium]|nr:right-handed parallel beta-helix repeat-containing protein [Candidatus Eremiobacteraeota bacterium]
MKRLFFVVLGLGLFFCAMTSAAQAQATRTWVSGLGDDANPCSRTAPCKTFPGAYSRTAVGGEIDVIDPGGFGTISIGHSITIDGGGGLMASILNTSGVNAVNINAGASDDIILRNLTLEGVKDYSFPGGAGVAFNSGRQLSIEHCVIENMGTFGVVMSTAAATKMTIWNSEINYNGTAGVSAQSSSGVNSVSISNSSIVNSGNGVLAHANVSLMISYSTIANNIAGDGVLADGGAFSSIQVENSTLTMNNVGAHALTGGTVRIGHNAITFNNTGVLSDGVGKVKSWMDNRVAGNGVPGVPDPPQLTYL